MLAGDISVQFWLYSEESEFLFLKKRFKIHNIQHYYFYMPYVFLDPKNCGKIGNLLCVVECQNLKSFEPTI